MTESHLASASGIGEIGDHGEESHAIITSPSPTAMTSSREYASPETKINFLQTPSSSTSSTTESTTQIEDTTNSTLLISNNAVATSGPDALTNGHQFILFPKLEPELRSPIWKYALPGPKAVEIRSTLVEAGQNRFGEILYDKRIKTWAPYSMEKAPVIFFVCREARQEVLRTYRRIKGTETGSKAIYCDLNQDIICLNGSQLFLVIGDFLKESTHFSRDIKRLAIGHYDFDERWDDVENDLYNLLRLDQLILGVQWYRHIVHPEIFKISGVDMTKLNKESRDKVLQRPSLIKALDLIKNLEATSTTISTWKALAIFYGEFGKFGDEDDAAEQGYAYYELPI